jgi:hypothetical protein
MLEIHTLLSWCAGKSLAIRAILHWLSHSNGVLVRTGLFLMILVSLPRKVYDPLWKVLMQYKAPATTTKNTRSMPLIGQSQTLYIT